MKYAILMPRGIPSFPLVQLIRNLLEPSKSMPCALLEHKTVPDSRVTSAAMTLNPPARLSEAPN